MINKCRHKITKFNRTNRIPRDKCRRYPGVCCVGEENCDYVIEANRIIKQQSKKGDLYGKG